MKEEAREPSAPTGPESGSVDPPGLPGTPGRVPLDPGPGRTRDDPGRRDPRIRTARTEDIPRVTELERASFSTPWSPASFHSLLGRREVDFIVAERPDRLASSLARGGDADPGRIVGYGILWAVGDEAELADLAVAPEWRRRGVGRALVDALVARARTRGVETIFLEVRESNAAARALYGARGFREMGVRTQYYTRPRENARVLRLDLEGEPADAGTEPDTRGTR